MATDGSNIDLADTAANLAEFGYPSGGGAFPQVRMVALAETATHAVTAVATVRERPGRLGVRTGCGYDGGSWLG